MIVPFKPRHLTTINLQPGQDSAFKTEKHGRMLKQGHCSWTCLADVSAADDRSFRTPVCCAGIVPLWPGRAMAWAYLDWRAGPWMVEITRRTKHELDIAPFRRIELYVKPDFHEAVRWAGVLGFTYEATMEAGAPSGGDLLVFKRLRKPRRAGVARLKDGIRIHGAGRD